MRCCSKDGKTCITPKPCATTTWKKAHEICSLFGRRICKADDLKNNKCCLTGCYFDDKLTWQWNSVRRPSEEEHVPQGVLPPSGVVPGVGPPIHVEPFPPPELRPPPRPSSSQEEDSPPYRPPGAGPSEEENDHLPYHEDSQEEDSPPYRPPQPPNFGTPQTPQQPNRPWRPPGPMDCCHRNPRPRCLTDSSVCREDLEYERYKARKERERQREKCKNHPTNCLTVTGG